MGRNFLSLSMLNIRRLILREVCLPLHRAFVTSASSMAQRRMILVELFLRDGLRAWGECVALEAPTYTPETVDGAWQILERWIAPQVLGRDFAGPGALHDFLSTRVRGHPMARAAVEMAAWGAAAELLERPLAALLGGRRRRVDTGVALGLQGGLDAVVERARQAKEEGYRRLRLKIAPGQDVGLVASVRGAVGRDLPLAVDANGAYRPEDAGELAELEPYDLLMIEQPLHWDDLSEHARLQRRLDVPLCLDESVRDPRHARLMIELEAGRILNLKPGRVGGLTAALEIHELCGNHGIPLFCGGMLESGIGRAYNVALASLPGFTLAGDLSPSRRYWHRDLVTPEWTMEDGRVEVPWDRPGLGVTVDEEYVESLTVRRAVVE